MRTIIVGDVHGCLAELKELLWRIQITSNDRVVMLGDFMDRGPDPVGVVKLVRASGFECVKSNHDEKHVRWRGHHNRAVAGGKKNPIVFDQDQIFQNLGLSDEDIEWMKNLPMSIDLGQGWFAIHAGLEPCKTFEEQKDCESLIRTRFINEDGTAYSAKDPNEKDPTDKWYWSQRWRRPEKIVYGHHIHSLINPRIDSQKIGDFYGSETTECIGIDTGCYAGGRLTAMILRDDGSYIFDHASALKEYKPLSNKYAENKMKESE